MSDTSEKMTITERLFNAIGSHFGAKFFLDICDGQSDIFQKHLGNNFPTLRVGNLIYDDFFRKLYSILI